MYLLWCQDQNKYKQVIFNLVFYATVVYQMKMSYVAANAMWQYGLVARKVETTGI